MCFLHLEKGHSHPFTECAWLLSHQWLFCTQPPSEVCDVSLPRALCKGLGLSCEDMQAGLWSVRHTLHCLHEMLVGEAAWVRNRPWSPRSPALREGLSLSAHLFLPPVGQGWGEYKYPSCLPQRAFQKNSHIFFSYLIWTLVREEVTRWLFPLSLGMPREGIHQLLGKKMTSSLLAKKHWRRLFSYVAEVTSRLFQ